MRLELCTKQWVLCVKKSFLSFPPWLPSCLNKDRCQAKATGWGRRGGTTGLSSEASSSSLLTGGVLLRLHVGFCMAWHSITDFSALQGNFTHESFYWLLSVFLELQAEVISRKQSWAFLAARGERETLSRHRVGGASPSDARKSTERGCSLHVAAPLYLQHRSSL